MTKGLIVVFHKYPGIEEGYYRILFDYFLQKLKVWGDEIDTLYLVNSNGFLEESVTIQGEKFGVMQANTQNLSHAQNLNHIFPLVKEDYVAIIDPDTIIYEKGRLNGYFELLEEFDVCSYLEKHEKIDRFAPYFFVGRRSVFPKEPDFSEAPPEHLDPFAKLTHEILKGNPHIFEVRDDRSTIQMLRGGSIISSVSRPHRTGIYHIRNFYGGLILLDTYLHDKTSFHQRFDPMPTEEITRLFGWAWLLNEKTRKDELLKSTMLEVLKLMNITEEKWLTFIKEFADFHNYV